MEVSVIASGSNGNCCLVEDKGTSLLIDAGKSATEIEARMNFLGKSLENVDGILVTHAHHDHICGAGVISRRHDIPLYMTKQIFSEANGKFGKVEPRFFQSTSSFNVKSLEVKPIITSHNVSSLGFVIGKFGLFTDTGIATSHITKAFPKLGAVLLESNHDIDMLIKGPYPHFLKNWIISDEGHLSNIHASQLVQEKGENLSLVLLGHLSGNNNTPEIARKTFETLVKRKLDYEVCSRDRCSGSWVI